MNERGRAYKAPQDKFEKTLWLLIAVSLGLHFLVLFFMLFIAPMIFDFKKTEKIEDALIVNLLPGLPDAAPLLNPDLDSAIKAKTAPKAVSTPPKAEEKDDSSDTETEVIPATPPEVTKEEPEIKKDKTPIPELVMEEDLAEKKAEEEKIAAKKKADEEAAKKKKADEEKKKADEEAKKKANEEAAKKKKAEEAKKKAEAAKKADAKKLDEGIEDALKQLEGGLEGATPGPENDGHQGGRAAHGQGGIRNPLNDYLSIIQNVLMASWTTPPDNLLDQNMPRPLVKCVINISTGGALTRAECNYSGQSHFDSSVERALSRARFQPFSPELMEFNHGQPLAVEVYFDPDKKLKTAAQ